MARPVRDEGSIRYAVVALAFESAPSVDAIKRVLDLEDPALRQYPRRQEQRSATIGVNPGGVVAQVDTSEAMGFTFDYVRPDGTVDKALSSVDKVLHLLRTDCSDLRSLQEEVHREFSLVLPVLEQSVSRIVIERLDRFAWDGPHAEFNAASVFRRDGPWLAANVFETKDLWHSHHGLFEYFSEPHRHRLLHVMEARTVPGKDAVPKEPGVTIVAEVKQRLTVWHGMSDVEVAHQSASTAELLGSAEAGGLLREYMEDVLARSDRVLSKVVNDEMCRRTGLERRQ